MELIGMLSAGVLLVAFAANQYGKLSQESVWYDLLNFVAALGLLVYSWWIGSIPFIAINGVWAVVSGADVLKDVLRLKKG